MNDEQIVAEAQAGNTYALETLVRRYDRPMLRYFFWLSGDTERAQDLRQDLFCKLFRVLDRYDRSRASFQTWIYRLAHNLAIDQLYRRKVVPLDSLEELKDESHPSSSERNLPRNRAAGGETKTALEEAMATLSELDQSIIAMKTGDNITFEEIGQVLGIPTSTVKSRLYRSFERLRIELTARGHEL